MSGKNAYLQRQQEMQRRCFDAGLQSGRQQILDMMSVVLNDPKTMGKDVFGRERLLKVVKEIGERIDYYQPAWSKSDEADYYQVKLDERLAQIYGDKLADSFYARYEFAPEYNYTTGKWK